MENPNFHTPRWRFDDDQVPFMKRLRFLLRGIQQPKGSRLYKLALLEMGRLVAFVSAVGSTVLLLIVLLLLPPAEKAPPVQVVAADLIEEAEADIADEAPPPEIPQDIPDILPPEVVLIDGPVGASMVDVPMPGPAVSGPLSPKSSTMNAVSLYKSPITLQGIFGRPGEGGATGANPAFGYKNRLESDLVGIVYDFKRDKDGKPRRTDYYKDLKGVIGSKFSTSGDVYCLPKELYLSHLFVPLMAAEKGPEAFEVGHLMEAKQWIAYYNGELNPEKSGTYRFVGAFDDVVMVFVDGKLVLDATWDGHQTPIMGWKPNDFVGVHGGIPPHTLVYGDWITLESGRPRKLEIIVGEYPGSIIGGVLLVQERGKEYKTEPNGRPILPIFTTSALSEAEKKRLSGVTGFTFDLDAPVMNLTQNQRKLLTEQKELEKAEEAANIDIQVSW